jgi:hypothetical protein
MVLVLVAAVALGAYNLTLWLRGARRPGLIAAHLLLGVGAAEALVVFLHNSHLADDDPARQTAKLALLLLAGAIFTGFAAPLLGKGRRQAANALLAAHVCAGLAGAFIVLTVVSRL